MTKLSSLDITNVFILSKLMNSAKKVILFMTTNLEVIIIKFKKYVAYSHQGNYTVQLDFWIWLTDGSKTG